MIPVVEYKRRDTVKRICVVDLETDPFLPGRKPEPFAAGFYDGTTYLEFWGDDCVAQFFDHLRERVALEREAGESELLVYAHNGGRFDFMFFLDHLDTPQEPFIMGNCLTKARFGGVEFRDSLKILPFPLRDFQKGEIEYEKMEREVRDKHKREILEYMKLDCTALHELVTKFHGEFGDRLTIAGTSLPLLRSFHGFETIRQQQDEKLRPFYFGGRCQCFDIGELQPRPGRRWKVYDVNSEYPYVMANMLHPVSGQAIIERGITRKTCFVKLDAKNYGALPVRAEDGGLSFMQERGTFYATLHEVEAGLETGTLEIERVHWTIGFDARVTFAEFVDHYYNARLEADARGDKAFKLFYKLILNSSYGKLGQNPERYEDHMLTLGTRPEGDDWEIDWTRDEAIAWRKPARSRFTGFFNVATAASITGAARAHLLRGLAKAERPVYCDTDSIVCEDLEADVDPRKLGAWKLEAEGDLIGIAGKKLYVFFDGETPIKQASKGARLTPEQLLDVCRGATIEHREMAPSFSVDGSVEFQTRQIKATAREDVKTRLGKPGVAMKDGRRSIFRQNGERVSGRA